MNQNNRRLKEIQQEKRLYKSLLDKSITICDCLDYMEKLDELDKEELDILKDSGVIV